MMIDVKQGIASRAHVGSLAEYERPYRESLERPEEPGRIPGDR